MQIWYTNEMENEQEADEKHPSQNLISFIASRLRKTQLEFPLIHEDARTEMRLKGQISVLSASFNQAGDGLFSIAEGVEAPTSDQKEQLVTSLFEGAATELTNCILGYPKGKKIDPKDDMLWNKHYQSEENYLHRLYKDRKEIKNKNYYAHGPAAALDLLNIIEYAVSINGTTRDNYINRTAQGRATTCMGKELDKIYAELIWRRVDEEKKYLTSAIESNLKSHGSKDVSVLDSPSYNFDEGVGNE